MEGDDGGLVPLHENEVQAVREGELGDLFFIIAKLLREKKLCAQKEERSESKSHQVQQTPVPLMRIAGVWRKHSSQTLLATDEHR
jgi:hypothetical protein